MQRSFEGEFNENSQRREGKIFSELERMRNNSNYKSNNYNNKNNNNNNKKCWGCGKLGHFRSECPTKAEQGN